MKLGILGPIGGIALAALIIGGFVYFTPTDSNWRVLGFVLGAAAFFACVALAIKGEKRSLNNKAGR